MNHTVTDRIILFVENEPDLNQNRLSQILGVERGTINGWFKGRGEVSPRLIVKLLERFPDLDANWLIRGETKTTNNQSVTGNKNYTQQVQGNKNSLVSDNGVNYTEAQKEIAYLKEIIKTKDEQITLLNKLIDK